MAKLNEQSGGLSEEYFEEEACRVLGIDVDVLAKMGLMSPAQWGLCVAEAQNYGPEKGVYFLREMFWAAVQVEIGKMVGSGRIGDFDGDSCGFVALGSFLGADFDANAWHKYCLERDRSPEFMRERLSKYFKNGQNIGDLGCGTGLSTLPLLEEFPGTTICGFDGSLQMLEKFDKDAGDLTPGVRRTASRFVDMENGFDDPFLKFDDVFDQMVANGVLYYLKDLDAVFGYVAKSLKGGGCFHFSLPLRDGGINELTLQNGRLVNREKYLKNAQLSYKHGREEVLALMEKYGFLLEEEETRFVHREEGSRNDVNFTFFTVRKVAH